MVNSKLVEISLMLLMVAIPSLLSSIITHYGLLKYKMPLMDGRSERAIAFVMWLIYITFVVSFLGAIVFFIQKFHPLDLQRLLYILGIIALVHIVTMIIYMYVYIKNYSELGKIDMKTIQNLNKPNGNNPDACGLSNEDDDEEDEADNGSSRRKYGAHDCLYNNKAFIVVFITTMLLFLTSFAFLKGMRSL